MTTINEYISAIDLDLSFVEKLDITCINELIKKIERFYEDNCIEAVENDIREKIIENFKKIIKLLKALYINFTDTISDYNLNYFSKKIERAPPTKFYFI